MTIPASAPTFIEFMDPSDKVDFYGEISQGIEPRAYLMPGENVASFGLTLTAEAVSAGLKIITDSARLPVIENRILRFWVEIDESNRSHKMFDGSGVLVGVVLTFTTDASPPRTKQRTKAIRVVNQ